MKEYIINVKIFVNSELDEDQIIEFAEDLKEKIMDNEELIYTDDVEVTEIDINDVEIGESYDIDKKFFLKKNFFIFV